MLRLRTLGIVTAVSLGSSLANAHFKLDAPDSLAVQNTLGNPQKTAPCGQDDGSPIFTPTDAVTAFQTGSTITITVTETVFHPGHYRVLLAQDMTSLPADPAVTAGSTACGSTAIDPAPTLPLLADGLLVHTSAFSGPQQMQVQLPPGMECTNCVLQVVQFMSNHGAPCFYHHCATVNIANDAPPPADAGVTPGDDAGTAPVDDTGGGCCSTSREEVSGPILSLLVIAALLGGRRRR